MYRRFHAMSSPPTITVTRHGSGRRYAINGHPTPGVTTILDQGYPKPALVGWAANETARYAVENLAEIEALGPVKGYEKLKNARWGVNNAAKVRGTNVHTLAEQLSHGETVDVPPHLVGYVDAVVRFFEDFDVTPLATETTVANPDAGYCGTFDVYATTNRGAMLLDYKTSKGVYPETALQLAAYRHAPWWLATDGTAIPAPNIEATAVVWLTPERYEVFPVETGPAVYRTFLYIAQIAEFTQADRATVIGEPL
jgi:hypothetical protein